MGLFGKILKKGERRSSTPNNPPTAKAVPAPRSATPAAPAASSAAPAASSAAPAASSAAPAASSAMGTKGAYLTFDGASNGTLFIVWSATPVDGAMAFFEPKKAVAEFKYKDKGGKSEIVRNMMQDKIKYYDGWCQFFKVAWEQHGVCKLLPGVESAPLKVEIAFLDGTKVLRLGVGQTLSAKNMTAIGCVPKGDPAFQAQTLAKDVFIRNARRGGAAITL